MAAVCLSARAMPHEASALATGAVPVPLAAEFGASVAAHLHPTPDALDAYLTALEAAFASAGVATFDRPRFVVLVDRSPKVQALLLVWGRGRDWRLVGASPVSTGLPGRFDHFATPLGVFAHSLDNPDFRAEGTKNEFGIRGYGRSGSRVFDFGWVDAPKGWGDRRVIGMRLQMHATDPDVLEQRLGTAQSKGCIRIPAALDELLDRFGVLDQDYDAHLAAGAHYWVLRDDRVASPSAGRYLVVVDSGAATRPAWAVVAAKRPVPRRAAAR